MKSFCYLRNGQSIAAAATLAIVGGAAQAAALDGSGSASSFGSIEFGGILEGIELVIMDPSEPPEEVQVFAGFADYITVDATDDVTVTTTASGAEAELSSSVNTSNANEGVGNSFAGTVTLTNKSDTLTGYLSYMSSVQVTAQAFGGIDYAGMGLVDANAEISVQGTGFTSASVFDSFTCDTTDANTCLGGSSDSSLNGTSFEFQLPPLESITFTMSGQVFAGTQIDLPPATVPLPAGLSLLIAGLSGLVAIRRRTKF